MNETDNERLAALAEALARLERRQAEILARLERLEAARVERPETAPRRRPVPQPPPVPVPQPSPVPVVQPLRVPNFAVEPAPQSEPSRGFEARMGLTWVNRIGVVTLVLGAAFFFKYAVESGWIGVWTRLAIGAAAGLAALVLAEGLRRDGQRVYAQGMAAAGIGILYLTVYAAFGLYEVMGRGTGFLLMSLVTAAAVWLALRHGSAALAGLGLAVGYATPLLIGGVQPAWVVLGYILLLNFAAVYLTRAREWQVLEAVAVAGTVWLYATQVAEAERQRALFTFFLLTYWALAAVFASRPMAILAQLIAPFALGGVWEQHYRGYFATTLLVAGGGLAAADRRDGWPLVPQAAFWLTASLASQSFPAANIFWFLTAAFLLFFAWLPWRVWSRGCPARAQDLAMLGFNAGIYFALAYTRLGAGYDHWRGPLGVVLATVHMGLGWRLWPRDSRAALFSAGVAWAMLVLAAPAQFSGYRVTQIWALEGAALAWIGARLGERRAYWGSLAIFGLALTRLLFIDNWMYRTPWSYPALANARFLTFLITAACLWAAAWWGKADRTALGPYIAGHVIALWGLSLEALGWAARTAENVQNAGSAAISILMAGYALALVGGGVFTGTAVNRALGLGLIGIVVLKLYFYDVWSLGLFYRMAAFAALGVLLLVMSYLYSRRQRRAE